MSESAKLGIYDGKLRLVGVPPIQTGYIRFYRYESIANPSASASEQAISEGASERENGQRFVSSLDEAESYRRQCIANAGGATLRVIDLPKQLADTYCVAHLEGASGADLDGTEYLLPHEIAERAKPVLVSREETLAPIELPKAIAFVDVSNHFYLVRDAYGHSPIRTDLMALSKAMAEKMGVELIEVRAYASIVSRQRNEWLHDYLTKYWDEQQTRGVKLTERELLYDDYGKPREKRIDASIMLDMMECAATKACDQYVLFSHDTDFTEVIERINRIAGAEQNLVTRCFPHELNKHAKDANVITFDKAVYDTCMINVQLEKAPRDKAVHLHMLDPMTYVVSEDKKPLLGDFGPSTYVAQFGSAEKAQRAARDLTAVSLTQRPFFEDYLRAVHEKKIVFRYEGRMDDARRDYFEACGYNAPPPTMRKLAMTEISECMSLVRDSGIHLGANDEQSLRRLLGKGLINANTVRGVVRDRNEKGLVKLIDHHTRGEAWLQRALDREAERIGAALENSPKEVRDAAMVLAREGRIKTGSILAWQKSGELESMLEKIAVQRARERTGEHVHDQDIERGDRSDALARSA